MQSNNPFTAGRRRADSGHIALPAAAWFALLLSCATLARAATAPPSAAPAEPPAGEVDAVEAPSEDAASAPVAMAKSDQARAGGTVPDFATYQPIIDRKPFGVPPPAAVAAVAAVDNTAAVAAKQEQDLAKRIGMCAVNIQPGGATAVGFIDNGQKPPRNYYLTVGESADGFTVKAGNYKEETATLEKDGVTITLKLGQGLVSAGGKPVAANAPRTAGQPVAAAIAQAPTAVAARPPVSSLPPSVRTLTGRPVPPPPKEGEEESYADRLRRRREELLRERMESYLTIKSQAEKDAEAKSAEAIAAEANRVLRAKNLELIRQGQPALPIQLTPDEDAQLVNEGVLQPAGQAPAPAPAPEPAPEADETGAE